MIEETSTIVSPVRSVLDFGLAGAGGLASSFSVLKWLKFLLGILLLPVCSSGTLTLLRVLQVSGQAQIFWVAFVAGAACWLVVFILLPKPMWLYVAGHELTHAIWTWACGGRVKQLKISSKGGHVMITKTNFLISLAPYFFPFYAAVVVAVFVVGHHFWGWSSYQPWFHLLLGAAYSFHVTLTLQILQTRQSDITQHGWLFSFAVIYIGNLLVLLLGIPFLTQLVDLKTVFAWWSADLVRAVTWLGALIRPWIRGQFTLEMPFGLLPNPPERLFGTSCC